MIFKEFILEKTKASDLFEIEKIQSLWSGYGSITRYGLVHSELKTVVVKHVRFPLIENHPRGWNTNLSHQRKVNSYKVEEAWYSKLAKQTNLDCRIPKCFGIESKDGEICFVLEDLDNVGYDVRKQDVSDNELKNCISWLANFHAIYLYEKPENLWSIGTYWHLDTRPEELEVLEDIPLKDAAFELDRILNFSPYQTIVHGDAKLANFCFSEKGEVAAVDFQYVGGGVGMKDLAYFVGSCFYEEECESKEEEILNIYFKELEKALKRNNSQVEFKDLEKDWRALYPVAWADFHRFLKGWSPGHWKINSYSERICREMIEKIND